MLDSLALASQSLNLSQHTLETLQIVALATFPVLVAIIGFLFKAYVGRMERNFIESIRKVEENCAEKIRAQDVLIANVTAQLTKERDDTIRDQRLIIERLTRIETVVLELKERLAR